MNLGTSLIAVVFFVGLAAIVVAQRLEIRSAGYRVGKAEKELLKLDEEIRVLRTKKAQAEDPRNLWKKVQELGLPLLPPEFKEEPEKPAAKAAPKRTSRDAKPVQVRKQG
ncbi:MAG: hypothetical protein HUU03_06295 [Planctomycetaceae bacterium]|nr:hypothetical protein [Planctomycetota bacterium]MCQ3949124.1 hypothetical protein [Planctomycetota bacterium]NUO16035.1 hypothetical protein [Planctomycetaceae bacterium]GIK51221.1 MAG: hypothetical protein BroJett014_01940 [Planctomycetota bacterium]HRJ77975.1 hypothetical protein [Planctomycetota bacterium]